MKSLWKIESKGKNRNGDSWKGLWSKGTTWRGEEMHFQRGVHGEGGKCTRTSRSGGARVTRSPTRGAIPRTNEGRPNHPKNRLPIGPNSRPSLTKLFVLRDPVAEQPFRTLFSSAFTPLPLIVSLPVCPRRGANAAWRKRILDQSESPGFKNLRIAKFFLLEAKKFQRFFEFFNERLVMCKNNVTVVNGERRKIWKNVVYFCYRWMGYRETKVTFT